ncbi:transposase [Actinacidiphila glaucinigra]|uniref:transposase n=1 Tax=Actinacidiphila glaucinigra TaxID=235986 RepID=UPI003694AC4E
MIFHSDRGSQYTSRDFATLASELGINLSVGRTGQCWDNALAESFFATIKRELIDDRSWPSRAAAHSAIFEWIEAYVGSTAASATALPPSSRPPSQLDQHTERVRQSGASSHPHQADHATHRGSSPRRAEVSNNAASGRRGPVPPPACLAFGTTGGDSKRVV